MTEFALTERQQEAYALLAGPQRYTLLYGGTRSAKTFTLLRGMVLRANKAPGSRQLVARFRHNAVIASVVKQTLPALKRLCFPDDEWAYNVQSAILTIPNHYGDPSEIWFSGLDDGDRVEKILGQEFCGILFNECSQIPYATYNVVRLRCAQVIRDEAKGENLSQKVYLDENPPSKAHWSFKLFFQHVDPDDNRHLKDPDNYRHLQMNPADNADNLDAAFIAELENASTRYRKRFFEGEFSDIDANALWNDEVLDRYRIMDEPLPDLQRIVVAVDPSGEDEDSEAGHDEVGISVVGLGVDGIAYVLEDVTIGGPPKVWAPVVISAFERHAADCVVGEGNFGGGMVRDVITVRRPGTPFKLVKASRGKVVRAEPVAELYERGKVRHVGRFPDLENELQGFRTTGYVGDRSPNRADALVWAVTELYPALTRKELKPELRMPRYVELNYAGGSQGWMS